MLSYCKHLGLVFPFPYYSLLHTTEHIRRAKYSNIIFIINWCPRQIQPVKCTVLLCRPNIWHTPSTLLSLFLTYRGKGEFCRASGPLSLSGAIGADRGSRLCSCESLSQLSPSGQCFSSAQAELSLSACPEVLSGADSSWQLEASKHEVHIFISPSITQQLMLAISF